MPSRLPPRFIRYYPTSPGYYEKPKSKFKIGYLIILIIGIFIGKSGYDWTKVQEALKIDQDLQSKVEQSFQNKEYDRVIQYSQEALNLKLKTFWKDYGSEETNYFNLAMAWKAKGEVDTAISYMQQALTLSQQKYGEMNDFTQKAKQTLDAFKALKTF